MANLLVIKRREQTCRVAMGLTLMANLLVIKPRYGAYSRAIAFDTHGKSTGYQTDGYHEFNKTPDYHGFYTRFLMIFS